MEEWLRVLVVGSLLVAVSADFQCICNFQVELQVYPDTTGHSQPLGYLYEFDCKEEVDVENIDPQWYAIAYEHQVAYVKQDPEVQEQMCPGDPATEDKVTTLVPPTTTPVSTAGPATDVGTRTEAVTTAMPMTTAPVETTTTTVVLTTTPTPPTMAPTTTTQPLPITTATEPTTQAPTAQPTTQAPTTQPTTQAPTTQTTTQAPTTQPTTQAPTTQPTTQAPTTQPTTQAPTTQPTTQVPSTVPTTQAPTTVPTSTLITGNTGLCPSNVHYYTAQDSGYLTQYDQSCYELVPHIVSWTHAESLCKNRGGHLVTIRDANEQEFLNTFILSHYHGRVWIGLHDRQHEEQFEWVSGHSVSYTNWTPGRKTSAHNREDCVYLDAVSLQGRWDDVPCGANSPLLEPLLEEHAFMCQYGALSPAEVTVMGNTNLCPSVVRNHASTHGGYLGQHGQACYELLPHVKYSWDHAESICRQRGGHLAYITSSEEQAYVQKFMQANSPNHAVWIGLHDTNTELHFEWTSGVPVTYTNWVPGHLSNFESHHLEDCVAFIPYKAGRWDDIPCGQHNFLFGEGGETHPPLCQYRTSSGTGAIG